MKAQEQGNLLAKQPWGFGNMERAHPGPLRFRCSNHRISAKKEHSCVCPFTTTFRSFSSLSKVTSSLTPLALYFPRGYHISFIFPTKVGITQWQRFFFLFFFCCCHCVQSQVPSAKVPGLQVLTLNALLLSPVTVCVRGRSVL